MRSTRDTLTAATEAERAASSSLHAEIERLSAQVSANGEQRETLERQLRAEFARQKQADDAALSREVERSALAAEDDFAVGAGGCGLNALGSARNCSLSRRLSFSELVEFSRRLSFSPLPFLESRLSSVFARQRLLFALHSRFEPGRAFDVLQLN